MEMIAVQTPRVLIVGAGESGKTLLAKQMAAAAEKRDFDVIVFDPIMTEWSADAFVTDDPGKFFAELDERINEGAMQAVFVDEADTLFSIGQKQNFWLLTRGRHYGLHTHVITQRPALVAPTIRAQCNQLFCFRVSNADAKLLADDFVHDDLLAAPQLHQGEFLQCYWKDRNKTVDKRRIF